ncbi:uncharacterized protein AB675_3782 [Cyphellophora attinorum]|uniref:Uncharacterized protein n=1 Tax=Cyphellophora attinorum TaxID=1664694 RepID=A0A0N0NI35_9EURO|nr:uncharacterized protein AB675_3782 [Phialophora attinorum]KPI35268.1 hypothetical protein AB675_3782 [Phialophora attinorum]
MAGAGPGIASSLMVQAPPRPATSQRNEPSSSSTETKQVNIAVHDEKSKPGPSDRRKQPTPQTTKPSKPKPRFFSRAVRNSANQGENKTSGFGKNRRIDITQSSWNARADGKDRETVTLNIKSENEKAQSRRSFRWVHHERETTAVSFAEFQKHVEETEGLEPEELAVATKCLEEVRRQRKISVRGRYFEETVHKSETKHTVIEEHVPVRATFISIPLFALLEGSDDITTANTYPSSKVVRGSDEHPLRTLLQHTNHLAIDDERDRSQVITRLPRASGGKKAYIHVPEFWALVVNMYTCITCSVLSVQELCGDNILLRSPTLSPGDLLNKGKDTRTFVKYTDRRGRLFDLECRKFHTLIDYVSSIEMPQDEVRRLIMAEKLSRDDSEYKLVDLRFQPVDKSRWIDIVDSMFTSAEFVHLRLTRQVAGDSLNLDFAQRQHHNFRVRTFVWTALKLCLEVMKKKRLDALRARKPTDKLQERIDSLGRRIRRLQRIRMASRFMLYAARFHLTMPEVVTSLDHAVSLEERLTGRQHRHRRSSGQRHGLTQFLHHSRPSSPSDSVSSIGPRSSSPVGLSRQAQEPPRIIIQSEDDSPGQVHSPMVSFSQPDTRDPIAEGSGRQYVSTVVAEPAQAESALDLESNLLPAAIPSPKRASTAIFGEPLPPLSTAFRPSLESTERFPTMVRRHSTYSSSGSSITLFDPSPLRRPLRTDGDAALRVPPRSSDGGPRPILWRQLTSSGTVPRIEHTARPPLVAHDKSIDDADLDQDMSEQAKRRISGHLQLHPFFKWQQDDQLGSDQGRTERLKPTRSADQASLSRHGPHDDVESVLERVDALLNQEATYKAQHLDMNKLDYLQVPSSSFDEVCRRLNVERDNLETLRQNPSPASEADSSLHEKKVELFLSTYGILSCFIGPSPQESVVVSKLYGILFEICNLSTKESRPTTITHRHEVKFIHAAAEYMPKLEVHVSDLLKSARPDSGDDETAVGYKLCPPIVYAFANIIIHLLCVWRAVTTFTIEAPSIEEVKSQTYKHLVEADLTFLRLRAHAEAEHDHFAWTESLKTADTLVALLVENALDIADGEPEPASELQGDAAISPRFDLRHVYSLYTAECIVRAKRHASARIYKDVKYLIEEINAIRSILIHQRIVFEGLFKKRESSLQALDIRVRDRARQHLIETEKHFEKLLEHANQTADWNQHFINVRGEDNNKAITVFSEYSNRLSTFLRTRRVHRQPVQELFAAIWY